MATTLTGASDDLIELRGDLYDEFGASYNDPRGVIGFSDGTLIFKWNENQIPLHIVLSAIGQKPLFGNRKPGGKRGETFWMVFFKGDEQ